MSKKAHKKNGKQTDRLTSKINLIAAILNLIAVAATVIDRLLR